MLFGFHPGLVPLTKRYIVQQLREAIHVARELGLATLELACTEDMAALGIPQVFGGEFMETLLQARDLRFHVRLFFGERSVDEVAINDTSPRARAAYLRKLYNAIEYFEHQRPMQLYILTAGPKISDSAAHVRSLITSLECLHTMFPDLPLAIENGRRGTLLEQPPDLLDFLNAYANVGLVFDTGRAYQASGFNRALFAQVLRAVSRFSDRLVEIHWKNLGPANPDGVPLHVPVERGVDLPLVARQLGRNPALVHVIAGVVTHIAQLARDRRALAGYLSAG